MIPKLYFITSNEFKKEEVKSIFLNTDIDLEVVNIKIQEIMHIDLEIIVRDKLLKAYKEFGLPCAVEHGAILIDSLNGLPGGISKVVWDTIEDKICKLILPGERRTATAKSVIGFCDGQQIHTFIGETKGTISEEARGDRKFQWDPIFIPEGSTKTFSEIGLPEKAKYWQGTKAWKQLIDFLKQS